jgi:outer membrane protein TolC
MKRVLYILLLVIIPVRTEAQSSMREVLDMIERNNPALKAAGEQMQADMLANHSETFLANPEVEFNYLMGADNIGGRHDLRVSQPLDIPTVSGMRSGKAAILDSLSSLGYKVARQAVLLRAEQICIELTYCNAYLSELASHLEQSGSLVRAYEKRLKAGDATILDLNKAKIHHTTVQGQANKTESERLALLSELKSLNGGEEIRYEATAYDADGFLPRDFETWFEEASARNPSLEFIRKEVALGEKQLSIDKAARFPELALGYMSEIRTAEKFRGVTIGLNIPLWSSANKIRQSRAAVAAARSRQAALEQESYHKLLGQFRQAEAMKANAEMMRSSLEETDNRDFLLSALTKGEISMIEYLVETDLYYEVLEQTLAAERDYHLSLASLRSFTL